MARPQIAATWIHRCLCFMKPFSTATKAAFLVVALMTICHFIWWYPKLPELVPSRFDANGHAVQTMSKPAYFAIMGLVHASLVIGFPLFAILSYRLPDALINLPKKEFWLADERRKESLSYMNQILLQIGMWTMLFMGALFHLSCQVAIKARNKISPDFYWLLAAFLIITIAYVIWINIRFGKLPQNA